MDKKLVIMDVDTGIDDALALILALHEPKVSLLGIGTVAGNVSAVKGALNTLCVLDILNRRVPVAIGLDKALYRTLPPSPHVHGIDGLGEAAITASSSFPSGEHAVDQLIRLARTYPGQLTLCALGPLSNVAAALIREPALPHLLNSVIIMGGAADAVGNSTPVAEGNIWRDPEAAQLVFEADWPLTMVGLDVTHRALLYNHHLEQLQRTSRPIAQFAARILRFYFDRYVTQLGREGAPMHDPLTVGILTDPSLVTQMARLDVRVETHSPYTVGMTITDRRRFTAPGYPESAHPVNVPLAVDNGRFIARLMQALLQ